MLWSDGKQIQPGIKVLSGPFDWQSAPAFTLNQQPPDEIQVSLCEIQEEMSQCSEPEDEIPDSCYNVTLAHIHPVTSQDEETFHDAASCTAEQLVNSWMASAETQTQPAVLPDRLLAPLLPLKYVYLSCHHKLKCKPQG